MTCRNSADISDLKTWKFEIITFCTKVSNYIDVLDIVF